MSAGVLKWTVVRVNPETGIAQAILAGTEVPEWASDLVEAGDLVDGGTSEGSGGQPDPSPGYDDLTVPDLKALIAERNEGRDDEAKIPTTGKKPALVAALEADDEASDVVDYAELDDDQLREVIAARNEGRDDGDLIADDGETADLVAALVADDDEN